MGWQVHHVMVMHGSTVSGWGWARTYRWAVGGATMARLFYDVASMDAEGAARLLALPLPLAGRALLLCRASWCLVAGGAAALGGGGRLVAAFAGAVHDAVRDDRYLVGRRLLDRAT